MDKQYLKGEIKGTDTEMFSGIASTSSEDRDGDTINQFGWELESYVKNPVLLFGHNQFAPPVGKTANVRLDENSRLVFDFKFASTPFAQELKTLVREGILNTFSVGFIPKEFGDESKGEATFTKNELLEISLVSVPANPEALVTSRAFKSCSEETKQYIMGEIQQKSVVNHQGAAFPQRRDEYPWNEGAERDAAELEDLQVMATWVDTSAPNDKASYHLLHHANSAEYPVVLEALMAAFDGLPEVPEDQRRAAYDHLVEHYNAFELDEDPPPYAEQDAYVEPEEEEEKSHTYVTNGTAELVELAVEDRELLKRVADNLEAVTGEKVSLEANSKGRSSKRNVDREVMIRALQKLAKTINKSLHNKKKHL